VAESITICSSRSRRPVGNFWIHLRTISWRGAQSIDDFLQVGTEVPTGQRKQNGHENRWNLFLYSTVRNTMHSAFCYFHYF